MPLETRSDYATLRSAVDHFLAGGSLLGLRRVVEAYDAPVSAHPDDAFRALNSDVWAAISEVDRGEATVEVVRDPGRFTPYLTVGR